MGYPGEQEGILKDPELSKQPQQSGRVLRRKQPGYPVD